MYQKRYYLKIFTVILLGLSINLPFFVTKEYLQYHRKVIRREVKIAINAGLKDEQLLLMSFCKNKISSQIVWEKADEFEYQNEMYDVVRQCEKSDSIFYWCWKDDDESAIKKRLNLLSSAEWIKSHQNDPQKERQFQYNKNLICPNKPEIFSNVFLQKKHLKQEIFYIKIFNSSPNKTPSGPPPDMYTLMCDVVKS